MSYYQPVATSGPQSAFEWAVEAVVLPDGLISFFSIFTQNSEGKKSTKMSKFWGKKSQNSEKKVKILRKKSELKYIFTWL